MKITRSTFAVVALAALAFTAGRLSQNWSGSAAAAADPQEKPGLLQELKDAAKATADAARATGGAVAGAVQDALDDQPQDMEAFFAAYAKMATPGEHHTHLESAAGTFEATVRMRMTPDSEWMQAAGTVTREWVLGKRFLRETVAAMSDMGPFNGLGYIGYNNYDGVYEFVWMEDMSTAVMTSTGTFDTQSKIMTVHTQHRDPATGRLRVVRGTWNLADPDREIYEGFTIGDDGREFLNFTGEFKRRK